jgi:molecular chaperone DnaK
MKKRPIIGIDLGTTFSALAALDENGKSAIVPCGGHRITPSCIVGPKLDPGTLYVGTEAKEMLSSEAEEGFICQHFKRHMGAAKSYTNKQGDISLTPVEASSKVLQKLVQEASKTLGDIDEVVITVPAQFLEKQRKATMEAGALAGLTVKHIINEPTAAALAFATQQDVDGTILIYDLGGGTFDVTIANVSGQDVEVLTSEGNTDLGGIDFDLKIAGIVDAEHKKQYGRTLKDALGISNDDDGDKSDVWQDLLSESEDAKKMLSKRPVAKIKFYGSPDGPVMMDLSKDSFESSISALIAKTEMLVEAAMDNIDVTPDGIDLVLLVGGSSRIPAARKSLCSLFGESKLSDAVNPDEAVAVGAAIYAGLKTDKSQLNPLQQDKMSKVSITDVTNFYMGFLALVRDEDLGTKSKEVCNILSKDAALPCSNTERFYTASDEQEWLNCTATQSKTEETDPSFVNIIYKEALGPLPSGRPSGKPIDVTFTYNTNGTLEVGFKDIESGMERNDIVNVDADVPDPVKVQSFNIE